MSTPADHEPAGSHRGRALALALFLLASVALGAVSVSLGWIRPQMIRQAVAESGALGMVVYILAVAVIEMLWIPRAWGLFAGGALYGPFVGFLLSLVADMLGGTLCYLIARGGGRAWAQRILATRPRAARVTKLLAERRGGVTVAFLRVVPIAHYTAVSYAAGVSGVSVRAFLLGNAVGLIPGAIVYPLIGDAALDPTSPRFIVAVSLLVAAFFGSIFLTRWFLRRSSAEGPASERPDEAETGTEPQ